MTSPVLNRRLALEGRVRVPDNAGGYDESWMELGVLWADVRASTGRERRGEAVTLSTVTYRITVRSAPHGAPSRPEPDQRFREGDRVFRILAVTERDPDQQYLTCYTREEVLG